jgi:hypothetical protein
LQFQRLRLLENNHILAKKQAKSGVSMRMFGDPQLRCCCEKIPDRVFKGTKTVDEEVRPELTKGAGNLKFTNLVELLYRAIKVVYPEIVDFISSSFCLITVFSLSPVSL